MCGIAGIYNYRDGKPADVGLVEAMTDLLRHRGPDDRGFFISGPLAMGMRRLSIIDVAGGAQPIGNEDGTIQIVLNGEIYNHRALRQELESEGHRFRTKADTEVVVHGYEKWGIEVLEKLNGMFAFALWDSVRRRLLLARDRLGIKPLYYADIPSGLVFGSELKAVALSPEVRRDLDPVALQQYIAWEYIPAPRTPFVGVFKLPAATLLSVEGKDTSTATYWRLRKLPPIADPREAAEGLRWHLRRSVRMQMEADVPVGAFLSGGLDSSAIIATLKEIGKAPLHTFSIGFGEDDFNEAKFARRVSDAFGTVHRDEILRPNCLELIDKVAGFLDEPFADSSILPTYLVSSLARQDVKVVLSGDGGDELFGGYDHYKAQRVAEWYGFMPACLRRGMLRALGDDSGSKVSKRGTWRKRLHRLEEALSLPAHLEHARWMVRGTDVLDPSFTTVGHRAGREDLWMKPWTDTFRHSAFDGGLARQLEVDMRTFLVDDILFKVDRASMAASLEARVPYLDHELVEYAFRIPDHWKLRWLRGKWILRQAFRGRMPEQILRRRKSGFSVPLAAWLRDGLRPLMRDLLSPARLRQQDIFQERRVSELVEQHEAGACDHSRKLWSLLAFQLWCERFVRPQRSDVRVLQVEGWAATSLKSLRGDAPAPAG